MREEGQLARRSTAERRSRLTALVWTSQMLMLPLEVPTYIRSPLGLKRQMVAISLQRRTRAERSAPSSCLRRDHDNSRRLPRRIFVVFIHSFLLFLLRSREFPPSSNLRSQVYKDGLNLSMQRNDEHLAGETQQSVSSNISLHYNPSSGSPIARV